MIVTTLDGWVEIFHHATDAYVVDHQPSENYNVSRAGSSSPLGLKGTIADVCVAVTVTVTVTVLEFMLLSFSRKPRSGHGIMSAWTDVFLDGDSRRRLAIVQTLGLSS